MRTGHISHNGKTKSIAEALELLNSAAENGNDRIKSIIARDYKDLKRAIAETKPELRSAVAGIKDRTAAAARDSVLKVDKAARASVWTYLGIATFMAVFLGFVFGRRSAN